MMYFIVPGIIICVLFLLMVPFKTDKARGMLLDLMTITILTTFIVWLQVVIIKNVDDKHGIFLLSCLMYMTVGLASAIYSFSVLSGEIKGPGIYIIKEYKKSKAIPLMTPEQIDQEAKIRLKMERLKDTLTFTERELEAKKYAESKK